SSKADKKKYIFFLADSELFYKALHNIIPDYMKRRNFLRLSAYAGMALGIPFLPGCKGNPANMAIIEAPFLSHIFDRKTMLETGKAYISQFPNASDKKKLEDQLLTNS